MSISYRLSVGFISIIRKALLFAGVALALAACVKNGDSDGAHRSRDSVIVVAPASPTQPIPPTTANADPDSDTDELPVNAFRREWDPGRGDLSHPRSRFLAIAYPRNQRHLLLALDTIVRVVGGGSDTVYARADSVLYPRLLRGEVFTNYCRVPRGSPETEVGGVYTSGTPDKWEHPRLAWRFDTTAKRIVPISPQSITCVLVEPD